LKQIRFASIQMVFNGNSQNSDDQTSAVDADVDSPTLSGSRKEVHHSAHEYKIFTLSGDSGGNIDLFVRKKNEPLVGKLLDLTLKLSVRKQTIPRRNMLKITGSRFRMGLPLPILCRL
jgi:hypothetical protein